MPGQRQSIDDLFATEAVTSDEPAAIPARPAPPPSPAAAEPTPLKSPAPRRQPSVKPPRRGPRTAGLTESQTPKWQRLERKELRLRADQLDELARLRRALNRQRRGEGERITENTLIRVAVDVLLSQADRLHGVTEDELRKSVTS